MFNSLKLKAVQIKSGITVDDIAKAMGVNVATVYRKMAGKSEFTASEMIAVKEILHIDFKSFCDIFLTANLRKRKKPKQHSRWKDECENFV